MRQLCVVIVAALVSHWNVTQACDCPRGSAESHYKGADLVFIGRAEKPRSVRKFTQRLVVLHTLKGKPGRAFTITRPANTISGCDRTYRPGEVDLVFVVKGKVTLCAGNYGMKWHWKQKQIAPLLRMTRKPAPPTLSGLRAALAAALGPLVKGKKAVPIKFKPWTGRSLSVGKTTFTFTRHFPKTVVAIHHAARFGPLHFIAGIYHLKGHAFAVLLIERNGRQEVVYQAGERQPAGRTSRGPDVPRLSPP